MYGRNQTTRTYNIVLTFALVCFKWNWSIQCGTNIVFIDKKDFNYTVSSGSLLHLQCFLAFSQWVTISFNSKPLVNYSERVGSPVKYDYHWNPQPKGILHVLTIKDVEKSDNGLYFCASEGDDYTIKQMSLVVTYIPEGSSRCTMSVEEVVFNNNRPSYQFRCSTLGYQNANISAFLNGQSVDEQANLTVRRAGNDSERTLSFSSNFDYLSSNPLFYCNFTDENNSPCIHESICYHSSSPASTNYWTYFNGTVTTTYQQNSITSSVKSQTNGYENLNFVIIIVVSLLVISLLLIFIGIKVFHQIKLAVMTNSYNKKSRSHEAKLNDVADESVQCVEPATRNRNCNPPQNAIDSSTSNEGFVEGMVMVKNELYESSKEDLLTCVPMIQNDIYESVTEVTTYEVESQMYSIIQRNQSCLDT